MRVRLRFALLTLATFLVAGTALPTVLRNASRFGYCVSVPLADEARLTGALSYHFGYSAQVTCTAAMVTAGACTSEQLGSQVTNPENATAFVDRSLREWVIVSVRRAEAEIAAEAARASERSKPSPAVQ